MTTNKPRQPKPVVTLDLSCATLLASDLPRTPWPAQVVVRAEHDKTGPELVEEIARHPTLDEFLDRDPFAVPYTDDELVKRVKIERAERAALSLKSDSRRAKRQGIEDPMAGSMPDVD